MENNDDIMITQSKVIALGWTISMIKKLLPEPKLAENTLYKNGPPLKLWKEKTVLAAMNTQEYKDLWEKANKRSKKGKEIAKKKAKQFSDEMIEIAKKLNVIVVDLDILLEMVHEEKINVDPVYTLYNENLEFSQIPKEVIDRWLVNFVRHNLVEYDKNLDLLYNKIGRNNAYIQYKTVVLNKIAVAYPILKEECERQINRLNDKEG